MKEELKDIAVSTGIVATGIFARLKFDSNRKYTIMQVLALLGVGIAIILILDKTSFNQVTKMSTTLVYGLISPSVLRAIIRAGNKSEAKAADKISDKFDNLIP